jgi:UV DNA damage endonuclease
VPAVRVRFGFVAMSRLLEDASPSHAVTVASVAGLSRDDRLHRLRRAALANLRSTLRILRHAVASGVEVYRFSSRLVPLATHPTYGDWPWEEELAEPFAAIGALVREHGVRVSFHPDHFTPLSSARAEVIEAAFPAPGHPPGRGGRG